MGPLITQALSYGYTASQILRYLGNSNSPLSKGIAKASALGYGANQIIQYLSAPGGEEDEGLTDSEKYLKGAGATTRSESNAKARKYLKGALDLGTAAYLGTQAFKSLTQSADDLKQGIEGLTSTPAGAPPSPPPSPMPVDPMSGNTPGMQIDKGIQAPGQVPTPPVRPPQQPMQQPTMQAQPQQPMQQQPAKETFVKKALKNQSIENLSRESQDEARFLTSTLDKMEQQGMPWEDPRVQKIRMRIGNLMKGKQGLPEQERARFKEQYPDQPSQKEQQQPFAPAVSKQTLAKGSRALTPSGDIAEIEDLPGKTAKINIDGKRSVMESDDLTPIPDNAEEVEDLYRKLLDKIPEGEKSRMADYVGYDANSNSLQIIFHDGKSYVYDDVPEDIVKEIVGSQFMAKTSGQNYIGKWYKDAPSIGAGISLLIKDLQASRGGKGSEYTKKFEELYSLHRHPKNKLKEKEQREKEKRKKQKKANA